MVADIELDRLSLTGLLQPVVDDAAVLLDAEAAAVYLEPEAGAESAAPIISDAAPDARAAIAAMGLTTATGLAGGVSSSFSVLLNPDRIFWDGLDDPACTP